MKIRSIYYEIRKLVLIFLACLFSPIFYFLIWRRKKSRAKNKQLKILVVPQLTRVGDLVCATPVFRAIKKKYPDCYLAVLVQNKIAGIVKNNPHIDKVIIFKSSDFADRVLYEVRKEGFDWSFCLSGTAIGTLVAFWGLIPNRVKLIREGCSFSELVSDWLNNYRSLYKHHTYLPKYYLKMLRLIGIENPEEIKEVFTAPAGDHKADEFLRNNNIASRDFLVGVSITAGNKIKEWGDEKFTILAKRISEKYDTKIIFIGTKSDEQRIDAVLANLGNQRFYKTVDFSLEELPSLIKRLHLFISGDTGPMHIAHALEVPLIDILGPVDPEELTPKSGKSIILKPPAYIAPSVFAFQKPGRSEDCKRALEATTIESVLLAVDKIIAKTYS